MTSVNTAGQRLLSPAYRRRFLFIMFCVCLFDFADRNVFNVTQESIKAEFQLSDFGMGVLAAAFAVLFAVVGVPIGRLADRRNRKVIVAACTALWSASTMVCGMAGSYLAIAAGRIGVGLGEAGFTGPVSSLVSDHFPRRRRASAMGIILLGTPVGILLGANLGGWAAEYHNWRLAFLLLGAPGLLVALCLLIFLREPPRGLVDGMDAAQRPPAMGMMAALGVVARNPALLWIMIGALAAGFGMTTVSAFLASFLRRSHELSPASAGALFGIIAAISQSTGFLGGAFGTDWLSGRDARWPAWGAAIGLVCAPPLYWLGLGADSTTMAALCVMLAGASQACFFTPTIGMIQNLTDTGMRATGTALFAMLTVLGGYFCAPPTIGFFSDRIAAGMFALGDFPVLCPGGAAPPGSSPELVEACAAALADGLQQAMSWGVSAFLLASVCYLIASRYMKASAATDGAER